jgi:phosphoglycerate kinase
VCAHLGRPKGAPEDRFTRSGGGAGSRAGWARRSRSPLHGRRTPRRRPRPSATATCCCENLRFEAGETSKDDAERGAFADQLAALADVYVGDGFGCVHRKHASVYDVPGAAAARRGAWSSAPSSTCCAADDGPERPYVVVLGGSKVSDKLGVIDNLLGTADRILVGGGMVFTSSRRRARGRPQPARGRPARRPCAAT